MTVKIQDGLCHVQSSAEEITFTFLLAGHKQGAMQSNACNLVA